jgi:hypothetical protein
MDIDANGNYAFKDGPPGTKINAAFMQTLMKEITNVIENAGLTVLTKDTDTRTQLWEALQVLGKPHDLVIASQVVFNSMIERIGANHYQIKTQYKSIFVKQIIGGYNCTTWLSGGDSWGYLDTNECNHIEFEAGTYIACTNTAFYLNVNTDNAYLKNIWIKGDNTVGAVTKSFQLNAPHVRFYNCKSTNRFSSTSINGFQGSATAAHNDTSSYDACSIVNQSNNAGNSNGFYLCKNIMNSYVDTLTGTIASTLLSGYNNCANLINCNVWNLLNVTISYGMYECERINNANIEYISGSVGYGLYKTHRCTNVNISSITGSTTIGVGAYQSNYLTNIKVNGITSTTLTGYGLYQCDYIVACTVETMLTIGGIGNCGFYDCDDVSSCYASFTTDGLAYGFQNCNGLTSCRTLNIISTTDDAYGIYACHQISGCRVESTAHTGGVAGKSAFAIASCTYVSSCYTLDTTTNGGGGVAVGFYTCSYIAASYPNDNDNTFNNYVDTDDASITNKYSTPVSADNKWD